MIFLSLTFKLPSKWRHRGKLTSDSGPATPKTNTPNIKIFFFYNFFSVWHSNDLQNYVVGVIWPQIWKKRPRKPLKVIFKYFLNQFFFQIVLEITYKMKTQRSNDIRFGISVFLHISAQNEGRIPHVRRGQTLPPRAKITRANFNKISSSLKYRW